MPFSSVEPFVEPAPDLSIKTGYASMIKGYSIIIIVPSHFHIQFCYQFLESPVSSPSLQFPSEMDTACDTVLFFTPGKVSALTLQDRTLLVWRILIGHFSCGEVRLSRVPMQPLSVFASLSDPDRTAPTRLGFLRWFGVVPDASKPRTSMIELSRLNDEASTVTVYASCHHF